MIDFSNECTRGNRILDQIFTNVNCSVKPVVSAPLGRSDHAVVSWFPCGKNYISVKKRVRNFCKGNKVLFQRIISLIDWSLIDMFDDPDFAMSVLHEVLSYVYDACFPLITVRFSNRDPPWMCVSLKILLNQRDHAFSKGNRRLFLILRSKAILQMAYLKQRYLKKLDQAGNKRDAWKGIRTISRNHKTASSPPEFSAEKLNDYFISVFRSDTSFMCNDRILSSLPSHSLEVSESSMHSYLCSLKKGNGGVSGLPFWIFKSNSVFLSRPIASIFNKCFLHGRVPTILKFSNVIPLPKIQKPTDVTHFRPISILPVLSKVLEKVVLQNWILPYVANKVNPSQFAYFPGVGKGTTCAVTLLYNHVLKFLDSQSGAVRILAADFSKAFDKLPFSSILTALVKFKLPREAIVFIEDFLGGRQQRVLYNDCVSSWGKITSGVPQGSVIGPFLFAIVMDSLVPVCKNSVMLKYADDVTILHSIRNLSDDCLQSEWYNLEEWSEKVGLILNFEKSCIMNCVTKKSLSVQNIFSREGQVIENVSSLKLLGITFSPNLSWNDHFSVITSKCYKRFFYLKKFEASRMLFRITVLMLCRFYSISYALWFSVFLQLS